MRRLLTLAVLGALSGCGSSTASPHPTPRPTIAAVATGQYTDPTTKLTISLGKVVVFSDHALFLTTIRNAGRSDFQLQQPVAFADKAIAQPTDQGIIGSCSADASRGSGLNYQSVPAGTTNKGWIRCDFPAGSHVLIVAWLGHALASYHIVG